ncbi:hypothetical protein QNO07_06505 [Streptomyces sp. 549]|uniref:hypothetical protein n=1 Tax=Streptomyces sp. 549 TaxID=3049076 RepID=UPI0024C35210|nr:hypothetical protein [Streptomyces sp. 549]MDK1473074.1 hypothetical protein [Streptomyces sp. 549]
MVRIAGGFKEFWWCAEESCPHHKDSLTDHTRGKAEADVIPIADYFDHGHALWEIMGVAVDVLGSEQGIVGGYSIVTDGEWIWRQDLGFYVRTYNLSLPTDLLSRIRELNYTIPDVPTERLIALTEESAAHF